MTKRDYDMLAACIKSHCEYEIECRASPLGVEVIHDFAIHLAAELLDTNPRFNMSRFLIACGVMEKTKA